MRRLLFYLGMTLLIMTPPAMAQPVTFGVGASGGINIPILQDDQGSGSIFEFRGRFGLKSFLTVEPKISFSKYGSPDTFEDVTLDIDGSKLVMYGIDAVLGGAPGMGFKPVFVAGLGFYNVSNDDTEAFIESKSRYGWSAGLGLLFGVSPKFDLDLRGKAHIITYEGSSSKKSLGITGGINYYFGGEQEITR